MLELIFFFNLELFGILFMVFFLSQSLFMDEEYGFILKNSDINFCMMILVVILYLMMLMVNFSYKMSLNLLLVILLMIMSVNSLMIFFYLYEMVFVLIMFVIVLLGYSYERMMAAFLMMFYSFLFSSPVLVMLLLFDHVFLMKEWLKFSVMINYFFIGSFMVKFPIFGFHYWLPVAHVEASTIGSMLLAGILLKLGSLGLFYVISYFSFVLKIHWMVMGVLLMMLVILLLSDLKMMIAYSSIAHMSMVFYVMLLGWSVAKKGAMYMMFYHGFVSPLMFWVVGMLSWMKTRSLLVVKMISFSYVFILMFFILCIMNMGFPPFLGFMSEILMLKSLMMNFYILLIMSMSVLFSCYYNIYLFWCFNSFMGISFKMIFFNLDLFMFLFFSLVLNFF